MKLNISQKHSGLGYNIVNVGAQARHLNEGAKIQLKANLTKNKKILVDSVANDSEAFSFANEIFLFLKDEGYDVEGVNQCWYSIPIRDQSIEEGPNGKTHVIIGSH